MDGCESCLLYLNVIVPRWKLDKGVEAVGIRLSCGDDSSLSGGRLYSGAGNHRPTRVRHDTGYARRHFGIRQRAQAEEQYQSARYGKDVCGQCRDSARPRATLAVLMWLA